MKEYVFINGRFIHSEDAKISVYDRGILYGDGFFTTMRAESGRIFFLEEHLRRLKESCDFFNISFPEGLKDASVYKRLLELNDLLKKCASVKIIITRGREEGIGLPYGKNPTYIVFSREYHPPKEAYKNGWKLISFNIPRSTPISLHKSLNYLYNLWAKEYAKVNNADEAILIQPDGYVSETSVGTIIFQKNGDWFTPLSEYALPSITLKMLSSIWEKKGIIVKRLRTKIQDLINADQVWVLNSLIGIVPVSEIDGKKLPKIDWKFSEISRNWLWS